MDFRPPAQGGKKRSSANFHQRAAFQKRLQCGGLQLVLVKSGFSDSAGKICFFFFFQFYVYFYSPIKLSQFKVVTKSQPQHLTTCPDSVPKIALFYGSLFLLGTIPPGYLTPSLQCSSFCCYLLRGCGHLSPSRSKDQRDLRASLALQTEDCVFQKNRA